MLTAHSQRLRQLRDTLAQKISARRVAARMYQSDVQPLSQKQLESIQNSSITETKAAERLLNIILDRANDKDIYECFLKALTACNQQFIVEYITHNGMFVIYVR